MYDNWIGPRIGTRRASAVDELDVQQLVDHMARDLDAKSVADRHMILHSMYRFGSAKVRRLVDHNPCLETQLPKRVKKPPKGVTLTEWAALYEAAKTVDKDAADLMFFIAGTGWRWSEAAALTVRKVEEYPDKDGTDRMWVTMSGVMRQAQVVEDAAKSRAGIRRMKLPASVAKVVRRRIEGKGPDDLVFTNKAGRKWYQQNFLNRTWTRIVEASGLEWRPTPHFLRHTHVALLDRAGATLPEMQRRIGHESIETTINVYGGMIDDIGAETLDALDRLLTAEQPVAGEVITGSVVVDGAPLPAERTIVRGELG
jgi:integrase